MDNVSIDEWISLEEYAQIHGVTSASIRQSILRGRFPAARKFGRNWMIPKSAPFVDRREKVHRDNKKEDGD